MSAHSSETGLSYRQPTLADAKMLLDWRTRPDIARWSFSEIDYDLAKQEAWLASCEGKPDFTHRIIRMNGVPIGYCSITVTDAAARIGTVGVYLGDVKSRSTAAAMYFIHILNHVFFALGLNKVVNQIMSGNERLRRAQLLTGYREVGVLRDHLRKGDSLQDVHIFEQTRDEWTRFRKKYRDWRDLDGIEWI